MSRKDRFTGDSNASDQDIIRWFHAMEPPHTASASPHFDAKVLMRIEMKRSRRGVFAWVKRGGVSAWIPALAAGLILSLTLNALLGYHTLEQSDQFAIPIPFFSNLREVTRGNVEKLEVHIERGDQYAAVGKYEDALQAYAAFLQTAGEPVAHVLGKMTQVHYRLGQYRQAIDAATTALALNTNDALAYRYRGTAYYKVGDQPRAIRDLQRAAQLGDVEAQKTLRIWGQKW